MIQSMPRDTAVTLRFSWEELAVADPQMLGRGLFCLDNLLLPRTEESNSFYYDNRKN